VKVIDVLRENGELDVSRLLAAAQKTFPGAKYIDVELHLQDRRILVGELESAPQGIVTVDMAALPDWLRLS
jgi:hypothetical protein